MLHKILGGLFVFGLVPLGLGTVWTKGMKQKKDKLAHIYLAGFLSELAILLLLRKLPGIEIPAMAAYRFAFCWGLADIAVSCWDEFKPGPS